MPKCARRHTHKTDFAPRLSDASKRDALARSLTLPNGNCERRRQRQSVCLPNIRVHKLRKLSPFQTFAHTCQHRRARGAKQQTHIHRELTLILRILFALSIRLRQQKREKKRVQSTKCAACTACTERGGGALAVRCSLTHTRARRRLQSPEQNNPPRTTASCAFSCSTPPRIKRRRARACAIFGASWRAHRVPPRVLFQLIKQITPPMIAYHEQSLKN